MSATPNASNDVPAPKDRVKIIGTIKKLVSERGFGFIAADDEKEYFFHRSAVDPSLDFDRLIGGERVEFEVEQSPKGPRAARVHATA